MDKLIIVNVAIALADSSSSEYPCNIFEPKEVKDCLEKGYYIANTEVVIMPGASTHYSIIFSLKKKDKNN